MFDDWLLTQVAILGWRYRIQRAWPYLTRRDIIYKLRSATAEKSGFQTKYSRSRQKSSNWLPNSHFGFWQPVIVHLLSDWSSSVYGRHGGKIVLRSMQKGRPRSLRFFWSHSSTPQVSTQVRLDQNQNIDQLLTLFAIISRLELPPHAVWDFAHLRQI